MHSIVQRGNTAMEQEAQKQPIAELSIFDLSFGYSRITVINSRYYIFNQSYLAEGNLDYEKDVFRR